MKRRFPLLVFVLVGLLSFQAMAQTAQTPLTVTIVGAVAKPGTYPMSPELTLFTLVGVSGGLLRPTADLSRIQVVRFKQQAADGGLPETITVDLKRIMSGKARNFQLQPGDVILVPFSKKPTFDPVPATKDIAKVEVSRG